MLGLFFAQSVTVETFTGAGDFGDTYAAPVAVTGMVDEGASLDVETPTGDVVESSSAFYCPLTEAAKFPPQSRVTLPSGAVAQVVKAIRRQASPIFGNVEHLEVRLR